MKKTKRTPEEVAQWYSQHPGSLYRNKEDANLLVKKRCGTAWTLNLGNPFSLLMIAGLNVLAALLLIL